MTYSVKQIQEHFGVSKATVLHWRSTGQLIFINVGRDPGKQRGRFRCTEQALREFEAARALAEPATRTRRRKRSLEIGHYY